MVPSRRGVADRHGVHGLREAGGRLVAHGGRGRRVVHGRHGAAGRHGVHGLRGADDLRGARGVRGVRGLRAADALRGVLGLRNLHGVIHPQVHCLTLQDDLGGAVQLSRRQERLLPEQKRIDL